MNLPARISREALPAMIDRAASSLAGARNSAEILEARDLAAVAYDAAKVSARLARAKGAHDELVAAAHRFQADALKIESVAKMRLADEYDAAQERGEVATRGGERSGREHSPVAPTAADIGLTRKEIHEARQIRDAEADEPGFVERVLGDAIDRGDEPTKAVLRREVEAKKAVHVTQNSGNNEWYTPPDILHRARQVLGVFDLDPATSEFANRNVGASRFFTADDDALSQEWPVGTIWMNPPYAQPLIGQFCERFCAEIGRGSAGIVLVNNATETGWFQALSAVARAVCFPRGRIKYLDATGKPANTPLQGQALIYAGGDVAAFRKHFADLGFIMEAA